jgi:hypothetical protein
MLCAAWITVVAGRPDVVDHRIFGYGVASTALVISLTLSAKVPCMRPIPFRAGLKIGRFGSKVRNFNGNLRYVL